MSEFLSAFREALFRVAVAALFIAASQYDYTYDAEGRRTSITPTKGFPFWARGRAQYIAEPRPVSSRRSTRPHPHRFLTFLSGISFSLHFCLALESLS